jgi:hypothetical protein
MSIRDFLPSRDLADETEALSARLLGQLRTIPPAVDDETDYEKEPSWRRHYRTLYPYGVTVPSVTWAGIYGVSVSASGDGGSVAILVDQSLTKEEPVSIYESPFEELLKELDVPFPKTTLVAGIREPEPQSDRSFICGGRRGTLGAEVITKAGNAGVLTAGHADLTMTRVRE